MHVTLLGDGPLYDETRALLSRRRDNLVPCGEPGGDLLLLAGYSRLLPPSAWAGTRLGALGFHPSLLPHHRGRDAVYWTVTRGDTVTGATWFWLDAGIDTGPIAAQAALRVPLGIRPRDLYALHLVPLGLRLLTDLLARLDRGERPATPQDPALATYDPPRPRKPLEAAA